jgi:hypothetical protein
LGALNNMQDLVKSHNIEVGQETAYEAFLGAVDATDSQPAAEISDVNKCAALSAHHWHGPPQVLLEIQWSSEAGLKHAGCLQAAGVRRAGR